MVQCSRESLLWNYNQTCVFQIPWDLAKVSCLWRFPYFIGLFYKVPSVDIIENYLQRLKQLHRNPSKQDINKGGF